MDSSKPRIAGNHPQRVLSRSLERRLAAYALAAGAGGVVALGSAAPADAQIIYTPAHVVITRGQSYNLDLNNDGVAEFGIVNVFQPRYSLDNLVVSVFASNQGQLGNGVEIRNSQIFDPAALLPGAKINRHQVFYGSCIGCTSVGEEMAFATASGAGGNWANVQNRYLGVRFFVNRITYFGWARFSVSAENETVKTLLTGYAYQSTPGKPILAGQTSDDAPSDDPPEQGRSGISERRQPSLGVLALGAQGLPWWRTASRASVGP